MEEITVKDEYEDRSDNTRCYICGVCSNTFSQAIHLQSHMTEHEDVPQQDNGEPGEDKSTVSDRVVKEETEGVVGGERLVNTGGNASTTEHLKSEIDENCTRLKHSGQSLLDSLSSVDQSDGTGGLFVCREISGPELETLNDGCIKEKFDKIDEDKDRKDVRFCIEGNGENVEAENKEDSSSNNERLPIEYMTGSMLQNDTENVNPFDEEVTFPEEKDGQNVELFVMRSKYGSVALEPFVYLENVLDDEETRKNIETSGIIICDEENSQCTKRYGLRPRKNIRKQYPSDIEETLDTSSNSGSSDDESFLETEEEDSGVVGTPEVIISYSEVVSDKELQKHMKVQEEHQLEDLTVDRYIVNTEEGAVILVAKNGSTPLENWSELMKNGSTLLENGSVLTENGSLPTASLVKHSKEDLHAGRVDKPVPISKSVNLNENLGKLRMERPRGTSESISLKTSLYSMGKDINDSGSQDNGSFESSNMKPLTNKKEINLIKTNYVSPKKIISQENSASGQTLNIYESNASNLSSRKVAFPKVFEEQTDFGTQTEYDTSVYKCCICDLMFTYDEALHTHFKTHTSGERPYKCGFCGKLCKQETHIIMHLKVHSNTKPYTCRICDMSFKLQGHLKQHLRIHMDQKAYPCDLCGKGFAQISNLVRHQKIHSGEQPYKCDICGMNFYRSDTLQKHHLSIHTDDRRFSCDTCGKAFAHKYHLDRHTRTHSRKIMRTCDICEKVFKRIDHFKAHKKTHSRTKRKSRKKKK